MTTTPVEPTRSRRGTKPSKEIIRLDAPRTIHRPVQTEIPAFEQKKIPAIERAADQYVEKRDLRMNLGREEKVAKDTLTRLMHENKDKLDHNDEGTLAYTRGDYKIEVSTTEKIKVKIGDEPTDGDEDAE